MTLKSCTQGHLTTQEKLKVHFHSAKSATWHYPTKPNEPSPQFPISFLQINFNVILPQTLWSLKMSFIQQRFYRHFWSLLSCNVPCPSHLPQFCHPNIPWYQNKYISLHCSMSSTSNWPEHHSASKLWTHCLPLDCVKLSPLHQLHICSAAQRMAQMELGTPLRISAQECYGSVEQWQSIQPIWKLLENQTHKLDCWTNQLKPCLLTVGNSNALLLLLLQLQCW